MFFCASVISTYIPGTYLFVAGDGVVTAANIPIMYTGGRGAGTPLGHNAGTKIRFWRHLNNAAPPLHVLK